MSTYEVFSPASKGHVTQLRKLHTCGFPATCPCLPSPTLGPHGRVSAVWVKVLEIFRKSASGTQEDSWDLVTQCVQRHWMTGIQHASRLRYPKLGSPHACVFERFDELSAYTDPAPLPHGSWNDDARGREECEKLSLETREKAAKSWLLNSIDKSTGVSLCRNSGQKRRLQRRGRD